MRHVFISSPAWKSDQRNWEGFVSMQLSFYTAKAEIFLMIDGGLDPEWSLYSHLLCGIFGCLIKAFLQQEGWTKASSINRHEQRSFPCLDMTFLKAYGVIAEIATRFCLTSSFERETDVLGAVWHLTVWFAAFKKKILSLSVNTGSWSLLWFLKVSSILACTHCPSYCLVLH